MMQMSLIGRKHNRLVVGRGLSRIVPFASSEIDHVCVVCSDVDASIAWYSKVLGMKLEFESSPHFYPTCPRSPAFMRHGNAKIALLPLQSNNDETRFTVRKQFGEHFALRLCRQEFNRAQRELPLLLKETNPKHVADIESCDYGHQLSLFFNDLDKNVVELTTWVDPESKDRLLIQNEKQY